MFEDEIIVCENCNQDFAWTAGEQEFFEKNRIAKPKFCMICRSVIQSAAGDEFRGKIRNKRWVE